MEVFFANRTWNCGYDNTLFTNIKFDIVESAEKRKYVQVVFVIRCIINV